MHGIQLVFVSSGHEADAFMLLHDGLDVGQMVQGKEEDFVKYHHFVFRNINGRTRTATWTPIYELPREAVEGRGIHA